MRTAVLTMIWNEAPRLPRWLDYYGQFGREHLYVIDHGSDDGGPGLLHGVNVRPQARTERLDESGRAGFIAEAVAGLLADGYEAVVFCDVDEFLVPFDGTPLRDWVAQAEPATVTALGFDVIERLGLDAPVRTEDRLLDQRPHVRLSPWYSKPLVTRRPVRWRSGFHFCDAPVAFGGLLLLHTRYADAAEGLRRLVLTRTVAVARPGVDNTHWAHADEEHVAPMRQAAAADYRLLDASEVSRWEAEIAGRVAGAPANVIGRLADLQETAPWYVIPERLRVF